MNRSDRLQPIADIATRKEKDAAQAMGEARQAASAEDKRLQDLIEYRAEYIRDFQRRGRSGLNGAALQQFQGFLARLDQAIEQQRSKLGQAQGLAQGRSEQWQQKMTQSRAINNAVQNLARGEQQQRDKREQRSVDDRAGRKTNMITG